MEAEASAGDDRPGRFVLDVRRGALTAGGQEQALRPKAFALLRHLAENPDRVVGRDEIMQSVWPGVFVTDDSISQCIKDIRRALGDDTQRLLRTLPKRGYLLAAEAVYIGHAPPALRDGPVMAAPPTGRPMVVVLPFEGIGPDADQLYFADGLTADLVTDLTRFQELHIVSPDRQRWPASDLKPPRGALPTTTGYVFKGSVRRSGGRIRVTAQLNDVATGVGLWAERFDRSLDDLFAVQEDLANHIAALVDGQVGREGLRRARQRSPATLDAYDLFLQGRELHGRTTQVDTEAAREMFNRAIAADPNYAPAYAYQAYTVNRGFTLGWGEPRGRDALVPALELANCAVTLAPESPLCIIRLAFSLSLLSRDDEAMDAGYRAIRANPCDAGNRATYGEILSRAGLHDAGVAQLQLAVSLNPFHPPFWRATLGRALLLAGRADEALAELRVTARLAPDYRPCHSSLVVAYVEAGQMDEARAAVGHVLRLRPGWVLRDYDGVFGFRRDEDTARFLSAFRIAGMPES
jgi:adenylate cyclase